MRCPVLVGREDELAQLGEAVQHTVEGAGRTVFVLGEAGVGKSRMASAIGEVGRAAGMTVLRGRASVSPAPAPYRPLVEAFSSALRARRPPEGPACAGLLPAFELLVPAWATGGQQPPSRPSPMVVGEAALALLDAVDCGLMVLEDLQWADPESLEVLEYVADQLGDHASLILATARDEGSAAERLAGVLTRRQSAEVLQLTALSGDGVADMIAASLGTTAAPDALVTAISDRAGGLPYLVEELLAALVDAGAVTRVADRWEVRGELPPVVPPSFGTAVAERCNALPAAACAAVQAASVLGERFDWRLLVAITGQDEDEIVDALRRGADMQLTEEDRDGGFRFRHALTRHAVLDSLPPPRRAKLANQALEALGEVRDGGDPELLQLAAGLAELTKNVTLAFELLLAASDAALRRGAVASACSSAQRAAQSANSIGRTIAAQRALLEAALAASEPASIGELGQRLIARLDAVSAPPEDRADVHRRLASAAVAATDWDGADHHLDTATHLVPEPQPTARARTEIVRAEIALGRHHAADGTAHAEAARDAATRADRPDLESDALALLGRATRASDLDAAEQHFTAALARAELAGSQLRRAHALYELGTIDVVRVGQPHRIRRARRLAIDIGAPGLAAKSDLQLAVLAWKRFELDDARAAAQRAAEAGQRYGLGLLVPLARIVGGDADAVLGRRDAARAAFVAAHPGMDREIEAAGRGNLLAVAELAVEDRRAALDELTRASALAPPDSAAARSPHRGVFALLLAVERHDHAYTLLAELADTPMLDMVAEQFAELAGAVLAGRRGETTTAAASFAAADAALDAAPWLRNLGRRLVAEAAIADHWGDPATWLRPALRFFEDNEVTEPARACRSLLSRAGAPVRRSTSDSAPPELARLGITSREADVLALLADGQANKEIAARLYLSRRTVEKHVERLMAKTATSRRAQLAALATRLTR